MDYVLRIVRYSVVIFWVVLNLIKSENLSVSATMLRFQSMVASEQNLYAYHVPGKLGEN